MAAVLPLPASPRVYQRHRPETTALYEVVRDNIETLYAAIDDGAIAVRIPWQARKELEAYLGCGLLCRGFARLKCEGCDESRLVAFSCKGRGLCPSCMGRRMSATAANLIERVLPEAGVRQWVLTFPFAWRGRLAQDGALLGNLTRIFVETVHTFYADRAAREGHPCAKTGSVTVVQRTSSDMRLNPHLHAVVAQGQAARFSMAPGTGRAASSAGKGSGTARPARSGPCSRPPSSASSGTSADAPCSRAMRMAPIPRATSPLRQCRAGRHPPGRSG